MADIAKAYPLAWPDGVPRTPDYRRNQSRFGDHSVAGAFEEIRHQIDLLGGTAMVVSTNITLKRDGTPYSNQRVEDSGVAVYFRLRGKPYCMPCDRWRTPAENLWAIAKHVEAMRGQTRWGVASIEQAFAGFAALPPRRTCWEVLGIAENAAREEIQAAWMAKARLNHPDVGGSTEAMADINRARDEAFGLKGQ